MGGLSDFNLFVRPQRELAERSFSGGAVTLCTFVVVLVVFVTQLSAFFVPTLRSEVTVEQHRSERLAILVDIELAMACPLVAMVASDAHLTHDLDILRNVSKTRMPASTKSQTCFSSMQEPDSVHTARLTLCALTSFVALSVQIISTTK